MTLKRYTKPRDGTLFTIGHSTRSLEEFMGLLTEWNIGVLADVRSVPRSRRNPQFSDDTLPGDLASSRIEYVQLPALGGWRRPRADSPNTGWRLASFRGFADYMLTDDFKRALDNLIDLACAGRSLALMCAEAVPWRCHRSLIADALTVRGYVVRHIMSVDKAEPHRITRFASIEGGLLTYPPAKPA
jgi:uncharacterized protein (DUF488 family)